MSINLSIIFQHPDAISHQVSYARIDNIVTPSFINVSPNPVISPTTIATNIPNGQYQVNSIPIYADGRTCLPEITITPACPGLLSITAVITSGNLVISYLAPSEVPKVRMTVNYPNGGSFIANYVNNGNNIVIALPVGLTGNFAVTGQSVCDEGSGFYSDPSSQVVVTVTTDNVTITNTGPGMVISVVSGIAGFTLPSLVTAGNTVTGTHTAFFGSISVTYTGAPLLSCNALLTLNGTPIQCVNIPFVMPQNPVVFTAASFADTDQLGILFSGGSCA